MTFISYAQNFEDVLLWRCFNRLETGFYVDLGAFSPDTDSVTRAFYDRGWHGINVEPVPAMLRRFEASRGRDINLAVAVGEAAGTADFFTVQDTGLSTMRGDLVEAYRSAGRPSTAITVPVETLAAICRRHVAGDIHFLKIDIEGAERAALAGADFAAFRPWVVVIEATEPQTTVENYADWEPLLLDAGYRFVWFDGLNRFYLAGERQAALAAHFRTPPNVFDNFVRAAESELTRRIAEAEAQLRVLQLGHDQLNRQVADQQQEIAAADRHAEAATAWVDALRGSTSWRITRPLRRAVAAARALRGRVQAPPPTLPRQR